MQIDERRITRQDFRDDTFFNQLTSDDRIEMFSQTLLGSSDLTKE